MGSLEKLDKYEERLQNALREAITYLRMGALNRQVIMDIAFDFEVSFYDLEDALQ